MTPRWHYTLENLTHQERIRLEGALKRWMRNQAWRVTKMGALPAAYGLPGRPGNLPMITLHEITTQ